MTINNSVQSARAVPAGPSTRRTMRRRPARKLLLNEFREVVMHHGVTWMRAYWISNRLPRLPKMSNEQLLAGIIAGRLHFFRNVEVNNTY